MASSPSTNMPLRSSTGGSEDATAPGEDASEVSKLFHERLQAYKHACRYLEDFVKGTEKLHSSQAKEYEKVLKTVNEPLREGHMFDRNPSGISEFFDTVRQNTLTISNSHTETAKTLDQVVLPIFKRLHSEIKNKQSELDKGSGKSVKAVDKARADTAKYVDRLGSASATYESFISKADPSNDPYILQRGVYHRLNKQIQEENSARQDMLAVQDNFSQFESHVVQMFQQGMGSFMQTIGGQLDQQKSLYGAMTEKIQAVDPLFEWRGFVERNQGVLIDPHAPPRNLESVNFANKNHPSTHPITAGSLERKSGVLSKWSSGFYVLTPAKFVHQFDSEDNIAKDPSPDLSLYLPDCTIGAVNGNLFTVKGKDISGAMSKLNQTKEYEFRASSSGEAETWWGNIKAMSGTMPSSEPSAPLSPPPEKRVPSGQHMNPEAAAASPTSPTITQGQGLGVSNSPTAAVPASTASATTTAAPAEQPVEHVADPTVVLKQ